jgi:transposase-like protein
VEIAVEETLTYYAFPEEHWRRIQTTDVLTSVFLNLRS